MTNLVFNIGSLEVLVWHLIAVAVLVLAVVIIIVACCVSKKKRKAVESKQTEEVSEVVAEPAAPVSEQPVEERVVEPVVEEAAVEEPVAEETVATEPVEEEVAEPVAESVAEEPAPEADDVVVEEVDDDDEAEESAEVERAVSTVKVYHVSLRRDDGMWQVKLGKGTRALKLFKTQADAIAFAKEKAKNQEGRVVIHKVDGKIRKLRY